MNNLKTIIKAVSHYVPPKTVTNSDLEKLMDTSNEWIIERTGIEARRFVEEGVTTSMIAAKAVDNLRVDNDISDVDLIIAATLSPDLYFPGLGVFIQKKFELGTIPALDIRVQCSGFVYGLATADAYIRSGQAKKVLLVCAEVQSPVLDLTTKGRDMAVLFGDGAGAVLLEGEADSNSGLIDSHLGSDGNGIEALCLKSPGTATPGFINKDTYESDDWHPSMDGRFVFKNAIEKMLETAITLTKRNSINIEEIDLIIPHQANLRIAEAIRTKLNLPEEKFFNNIQKYGNTTAATIPICLSEAKEQGRLKKGDLVLTLAFGAGFTWGGNLFRF